VRGIILYDKDERVVGYVEASNQDFLGRIKLLHNFKYNDLVLSFHTDGNFHMFEPRGINASFTLDKEIDLNTEIFASLVRRQGESIVPLASGILNTGTKTREFVNEVDSLIHTLWHMDEEQAQVFTGCLYSFA